MALTWSLITYRAQKPLGGERVGVLRADGVVVEVPTLVRYPGLRAVFAENLDLRIALRGFDPAGARPVPGAQVLAPVRFPNKLLCAGANYESHVLEMTGHASPPGAVPWFFSVPASTTVVGPGHPVLIPPDPAARVDWEAELAVVLGRPLRHATPAQARAAIAGYTVLNDISARGLSRPAVPLAPPMSIDWLRHKAHDTFCPMGPGLTPAWLVDDPGALRIRMWLNGELRQDGNTGDMVFDVPTLLCALSDIMTLEPGDVIATGTPAGTGSASGRYLADGDLMEIEIDGIGRLANPVRTIPADHG